MKNPLSALGLGARPQAPATGGLVGETTTQTFARDVIEESRTQPVLVDFWAPWCGPCKQLGPVLEAAVTAAGGAVKLVKMNIDEHPSVAGQLGIQSIPAVIAFVDGQPVDGFVGALPDSQVKAFIDRLAGPAGGAAAPEIDLDQILAEADGMLAAGNLEGAAMLYGELLQVEPGEMRALGGLARAAISGGDLDRARQILAMAPEDKAADPALAPARAALALAEQTASLGDPDSLRQRIAADPADHQARYDLALLLNAAGDREAATGQLLDILRAERSWEEEKARKQLLTFFEAWGPADPATLAGRRRLSSLLFA